MAKETTKYEALMTLEIIGPGHPCTIHSERIAVDRAAAIHITADSAYKALTLEIAERGYQKLKEKLPKVI